MEFAFFSGGLFSYLVLALLPVNATTAVLPGLVQESFQLPVDTLNGQPIGLDGRVDQPAGPSSWPLLIVSPGSGPSDVDFVPDAPDGHVGPNLTAAAARQLAFWGWGRKPAP